MIYLIGGPPKCGKTTLAKKLSKKMSIPLISIDSLQCSIMPYLDKEALIKKFPTSQQRCNTNDEKYSKYSKEEIIEAYQGQAKTIQDAIEMFIVCEMADEGVFVMEGYHIEPKFALYLQDKYPGKIKSIFLTKTDKKEFVKNIKKSSTPNDWIIENTKAEETYFKIAEMITEYSSIFEHESKKYGLDFVNMDDDFENKIRDIVNEL